MFDPERDEVPGRHRFALRIGTLFAVGLCGGLVLLPSVTGFEAGPDRTETCVAIRDAWYADRAAPSEPAFPAARPSLERQPQLAYLDWLEHQGACIHESRHRLIVTGIGLGILALVLGGGVALVRSRQRRSRAPSWVTA